MVEAEVTRHEVDNATGHVDGVVAESLVEPGEEGHVEGFLRVSLVALGEQLRVRLLVEFVERVVVTHDLSGDVEVALPHEVDDEFGGVIRGPRHLLEDVAMRRGDRRVRVGAARRFRDMLREVPHALESRGDAEGGHEGSQIEPNGLLLRDEEDAPLVDAMLEAVEFGVVCDDGLGEVEVLLLHRLVRPVNRHLDVLRHLDEVIRQQRHLRREEGTHGCSFGSWDVLYRLVWHPRSARGGCWRFRAVNIG